MIDFKRLFIKLIFIAVATIRYGDASDTVDPNLFYSEPAFQQLGTRLSALEEQSKSQQHRIVELEKQNEIQHQCISKLEARDLAQQKQNGIQQNRIAELEARDLVCQDNTLDLKIAIRNHKQQTEEVNGSLIETKQAYHNLQDVMTAQKDKIKELNGSLTETNEAYRNLHDVMTAQNDKIKELNGSLTESKQANDKIQDVETAQKEEVNESGIEEQNEDSSSDNRILSRRQEAHVTNVAFTSILTHNLINMGLDQNVRFDKVETNIGNAYNAHHGVFIAPVVGTYVFHVSICTEHNTGTSEGYCKIVVNGVHKVGVYARAEAKAADQSSQMLVVHLNQGDDVAIQTNHYYHDSVYGDGNYFSTFSGFLLRSDAEVNTIVG